MIMFMDLWQKVRNRMKRDKIKSLLRHFCVSLVSISATLLIILGLFDPSCRFLVVYISAFPICLGVSLLMDFIKFGGNPKDKDGDDHE